MKKKCEYCGHQHEYSAKDAKADRIQELVEDIACAKEDISEARSQRRALLKDLKETERDEAFSKRDLEKLTKKLAKARKS